MVREEALPTQHPTDRIIGEAPIIQALRAQIRHLAAFDAVGNPYAPTLLFQGETGTGKGLLARIVHDSGPRARGPFIEVNCAAIPETLLEAELFGFEAGAFTDAKRAKPGLFEAASGGGLFLDEIEALPPRLQSKLLTAIEAKRIRRLGAVGERPVDVKLISATQTDLSHSVSVGRFRADLYHRLAVVILALPPLRNRGDDILLLARSFLRRYSEVHGLPPKGLSRAAEAWLLRYDWPGNVRELSHLMERVTLLSPETIVAPDSLERLCLPRLGDPLPLESESVRSKIEVLDEPTRIRRALMQAEGNVMRAARLLGLGRGALRHRMRRYGIEAPSHEHFPHPPSASGARQDSCPRALPVRQGVQVEGSSTYRDHITDTSATRAVTITAWDWARKPVAILAINVTFPEQPASNPPGIEPWTVAARWQQYIEEKVAGFGGILLQRSPTLLVVAFGLPRTLDQLPQRAVQAALAIRQSMAEAATSDEEAVYPVVRLAVHDGTVLVDAQASDPADRVLPVGETLTLPVRLLGFAAPGDILLSSDIRRMVEGWYQLHRREVQLSGGEGEHLAAYLLMGLRAQPSPLEHMGQRALSRFVGRERELAALREILAQVEGGRGRVVGIVGEPGVGKSRLLYEFLRRMASQQVLCLEAHCSSYGATVPYLPLRDLLTHYFQLEEHDDEHSVRGKVMSRLLALEEALAPTLPAFLALLGLPVDDPQWQALDPSQRRQRILEGLKCLLLRESEGQPLVLVVENLHWLDTETQAFLDSLVDSLPTVRALLLITYRPEYRHSWGSKTIYAQLRLDPLPRHSTQEFLQALLGDAAGLAPLKSRLIDWTEGNPFFLEESIQTLVETGALVGEDGAYRLARAVPSIQVPSTVQAVLGARIDRLPPEERDLLQSAAVIGKDVPYALLQHVVEQPEDVGRQCVVNLQDAEFLYETRLFPALDYTFKHALTHEVAYGSLPQERRRALHARIVAAIERLYPDRLSDHVDRLAHHAFQGEVWDKAMTYFWQAGTKAFLHSANREAAACYERALTALQHLPESHHTREQAIDLRSHLGNALVPLGEFRRILDRLHEAESLAEALPDQRRLGRILSFLSFCVWMTGDHERAIALGQRALNIAQALGDVPLQVRTNFYVGQAYHTLGDYRRAMAVLREIMASLGGEPTGTRLGMAGLPAVFSRTWLVWCLAEVGEFAEGVARGEEGVRMGEAVDHPFSLAMAYGGLGFVHLRRGDLPGSIAVLERGLAVCKTWNIGVMVPWASSMLGAAYALAGRADEAHPLLEQAVEGAAAMGILGRQSLQLAWLAETHLLAGRQDEALIVAKQALDLARAHEERGHEAWALRLLGEIASRRDPPDGEEAEAWYHQALTLAEDLSMWPLLAHCRLGLGRLYRRLERWEPARSELAAAIHLLRGMDVSLWLEQAEADLAQIA